ncbi:hypothetical protein B0H13DRAFT_1599644, partial [Mycena leptocephala]
TSSFVADNPGTWFFHCHIEWHLDVGLAVQLIEAPLIAQKFKANLPSQIVSSNSTVTLENWSRNHLISGTIYASRLRTIVVH